MLTYAADGCFFFFCSVARAAGDVAVKKAAAAAAQAAAAARKQQEEQKAAAAAAAGRLLLLFFLAHVFRTSLNRLGCSCEKEAGGGRGGGAEPIRGSEAAAWGLKLLVYEALSYWCMRP
jgi:hypothetical protein